MTANLDIFGEDRSINHLAIAIVKDTLTGTYTAWHGDMPYLVVQGDNKEEVKERLKDALIMYLNSICKR